ncbi:MFS transporter [Pantoea ananatis]
MFYTPDLQGHAKVMYAFITYLILSLLYSGVNIPYCSLGGVITTNAQERVSCQQFRFMGAGNRQPVLHADITANGGLFR